MTSWKKSPVAVLIVMIAIHVLAHIDRNMLLAFSPAITKDLELNNAQYGFLVGAVWVLSFGFMAIFMGSLADRFSRTRIIAAGVLIWSVCTWASGHAHSFGQLAVARFFVASGEAALVPSAVALLAELFSARRRGTALGIFFVGIPLGIGLSFVLADSVGAGLGWRETFTLLGVVGVVIAVGLSFLREERVASGDMKSAAKRGEPFIAQSRAVFGVMVRSRALLFTVIGFVLIHLVFAGFSFAQLWLVRERGFEAATIAKTIGEVQIVFGVLGAVVGGVLGDRLSRRLAGGQASFMMLLVAVCAPFMIAYRFVPVDSPFFYVGMCAASFLPLALYGPANSLVQGLTPEYMRSTMAGLNMTLINVFALALGTVLAGAVIDRLSAAGNNQALTLVLLAVDMLALASGLLFWLAARQLRLGRATVDRNVVPTLAH
jgi:predicted MFS family arabinose efflux permease